MLSLEGQELGHEGGSQECHRHADDHADTDCFMEKQCAPEDSEDGNHESDGGGCSGPGAFEDVKEEDKGEGRAEEGESEGSGDGPCTRHCWRRKEEGQREKNQGGAEEAACRDHQRTKVGKPGFRVVAGDSVGAGRQQDRDNGPACSALFEIELIPSQDGDAKKADEQSENLGAEERKAQPEEADNGGEDRSRGVEEGRESCGEAGGGKSEETEGEGGIYKTEKEERGLVLEGEATVFGPEEDGQKDERPAANAAEDHCEGSKLRNGDAHEQEGCAPDRGEQHQSNGVGEAHR